MGTALAGRWIVPCNLKLRNKMPPFLVAQKLYKKIHRFMYNHPQAARIWMFFLKNKEDYQYIEIAIVGILHPKDQKNTRLPFDRHLF